MPSDIPSAPRWSKAIAAQPGRAPGPNMFDWFLLHATLVGQLLNYGRLQTLLPGGHSLIAYAPPMACALISTALLAINREWRGALMSGLLFGLGALSLIIFSLRTGLGFNINAISVYSPLLILPVFYWLFLRGGADGVIKILLLYAVIYAVLYIMLSLAILAGALQWQDGPISRLISGDSLRRDRIILAPSWLALGFCLAIGRLRSGLDWKAGLLLLLFGTAAAFALARVFTLVLLLLAVAYWVTRSTRVVGYIGFFSFLVVSLILLAGLTDPFFNPFTGREEDASITARAWGYEYVRDKIPSIWLFGFGFPSSEQALIYATSSRLFFPVDLGTVGMMYSYGAVGLVLLIISNWICATAWRTEGVFENPVHKEGVSLLGAFTCLQGISYSTIWLDSGFVLALTIAGRMYLSRWNATSRITAR